MPDANTEETIDFNSLPAAHQQRFKLVQAMKNSILSEGAAYPNGMPRPLEKAMTRIEECGMWLEQWSFLRDQQLKKKQQEKGAIETPPEKGLILPGQN